MLILLLLLGAVGTAAVISSSSKGGKSTLVDGVIPSLPPADKNYFQQPTFEPQGPPTVFGGQLTKFSPDGVMWVLITNVITDDQGNVSFLYGLDIHGKNWWIGGIDIKGNRIPQAITSWPDEHDDGFFSNLSDWVLKIVDIAATVISVVYPGIGTVVGVAIHAWVNMARGASINTAVFNGLKEGFAKKNPDSISAWNEGIAAASTLSEATAVAAGEKWLSQVNVKDVQDAFTTALHLTRGKQTQDIALGKLAEYMTDDQMRYTQHAMKIGARLDVICNALGGQRGLELLDQISAYSAASIATILKSAKTNDASANMASHRFTF